MSSIKFSVINPHEIASGSWDHSVRLWDAERSCSILTIVSSDFIQVPRSVLYPSNNLQHLNLQNTSKVVTSVALPFTSHGLLAASHPDHAIRLWDARAGGSAVVRLSLGGHSKCVRKYLSWIHTILLNYLDNRWVSSVAFSPVSMNALISTGHDGTLKMWDLRTTSALHTNEMEKVYITAISNISDDRHYNVCFKIRGRSYSHVLGTNKTKFFQVWNCQFMSWILLSFIHLSSCTMYVFVCIYRWRVWKATALCLSKTIKSLHEISGLWLKLNIIVTNL